MRRPARDTRKAIDAFIARKAEIDAMLARGGVRAPAPAVKAAD